jgi:hypothetical protein
MQKNKALGRDYRQKVRYARMKIVPQVPTVRPDNEPSFPANMTGARIVAIGTTEAVDLEEHGLLIDYIPDAETRTFRAVIGFNDLGMSVNELIELGRFAAIL